MLDWPKNCLKSTLKSQKSIKMGEKWQKKLFIKFVNLEWDPSTCNSVTVNFHLLPTHSNFL